MSEIKAIILNQSDIIFRELDKLDLAIKGEEVTDPGQMIDDIQTYITTTNQALIRRIRELRREAKTAVTRHFVEGEKTVTYPENETIYTPEGFEAMETVALSFNKDALITNWVQPELITTDSKEFTMDQNPYSNSISVDNAHQGLSTATFTVTAPLDSKDFSTSITSLSSMNVNDTVRHGSDYIGLQNVPITIQGDNDSIFRTDIKSRLTTLTSLTQTTS